MERFRDCGSCGQDIEHPNHDPASPVFHNYRSPATAPVLNTVNFRGIQAPLPPTQEVEGGIGEERLAELEQDCGWRSDHTRRSGAGDILELISEVRRLQARVIELEGGLKDIHDANNCYATLLAGGQIFREEYIKEHRAIWDAARDRTWAFLSRPASSEGEG